MKLAFIEYLVILRPALIQKQDITYILTHINMSNPLIAYADLLPNHIADPNHIFTAHITICAIDKFSSYPWLEPEPEARGTLFPSSDLVMMACSKYSL